MLLQFTMSIERYDESSMKARQGEAFEDWLVALLNTVLIAARWRAYTLRMLHRIDDVLTAVAKRREGFAYQATLDTAFGDIYIFDETHEPFGMLIARIGCKSTTGDSVQWEQESFLRMKGSFAAIGMVRHAEDGTRDFEGTRIVPGAEIIRAYELSRPMWKKPDENWAAFQFAAYCQGAMRPKTFAHMLLAHGSRGSSTRTTARASQHLISI